MLAFFSMGCHLDWKEEKKTDLILESKSPCKEQET